MSWVEWRGRAWPTSVDEARLRLHLWPEDAGCPRQSWHLHLQHIIPRDDEESGPQFVSAEIGTLHFCESDWRRFAGLEIRADAQWHAAREGTNEYGRLRDQGVLVMPFEGLPRTHRLWQGHDFVLRIGARDGLVFPCEFDAWVQPDEEYYRKVPEPPGEAERFAEGPPNLRVITRLRFDGGVVNVPRLPGSGDPAERAIAWARRALREEVSCEDFHDARLSWALRQMRDGKGSEPLVGWGSTVNFTTSPRAAG